MESAPPVRFCVWKNCTVPSGRKYSPVFSKIETANSFKKINYTTLCAVAAGEVRQSEGGRFNPPGLFSIFVWNSQAIRKKRNLQLKVSGYEGTKNIHVIHAHLTEKSSNSVLSQSKSNEFDKISRVFLSVIV